MPTFWYFSEAPVSFPGADSPAPSMLKDSFATSARGFVPLFLGPGAFFTFFVTLGGVLESTGSLASFSDTSSSELWWGRFFEVEALVVVFGLRVVCVDFFGAALLAAGFALLALDFCEDAQLVRIQRQNNVSNSKIQDYTGATSGT
jgi:hypothetical protein